MTASILISDNFLNGTEVDAMAAKLASGLHALGIRKGGTVALLLYNDFAGLIAARAIRRLGANAVLLNYHNRSAELAYILHDSQPGAVIGHDSLLCEHSTILPPVPVLIVPDSPRSRASPDARSLPRTEEWERFIERFPPSTAEEGYLGTDAIIYTSGTTGSPKGVRRFPLDDARGPINAAEMTRIFGVREDSRTLVLGPAYHSMPDTVAKLTLEIGELLIMQRKFDAEDTLRLIERHRITEVAMVPTMLVRLCKLPAEVRERYDVSSLRTVTHTGSACPPDIKRKMIDWWGPIIHELYGATEIGVAFFTDSEDWLRKPGTVGRAMPGTTVAIVDDSGEPLPPGAPGEIFVRNDHAPDWEYIGHPKTDDHGDLVSVGDIGYLDDDGFLFLCDRKSDMIISGGVNIYPAEIEAVIITHPAIADCAVFGAYDAEYGEKVVVALVLREGHTFDAEKFREFLGTRLTAYKIPRIFDLHESLPRLESGKVLKRELKCPYWPANLNLSASGS